MSLFQIIGVLLAFGLPTWAAIDLKREGKKKDKRIAELSGEVQLLRETNMRHYLKFTREAEALTIPPLRTDETHTWTPHDSASWRAIMLSDLGKKFIGVTKQAHFRMCQSASANTVRPELDIHCARGFFECIKWMNLMTISPSSGANEQNTVASEGDTTATDAVQDNNLERYSPK